MKRLGLAPFSEAFFDELRAGFGGDLRIGLARVGPVVAAVDLMISFHGVRYSLFAGSRADLWHLYPNQILLWAEMQHACAAGDRSFDLGRSLVASGSLEFKLAWGGKVVPLTYGYHLQRARRLRCALPTCSSTARSVASGRAFRIGSSPLGPRLVKHLF
jgi:hypothetical protein